MKCMKFILENLFIIEGTKSLDAGKLKFVDDGINFVGRINENNGIQGKIAKQKFEPNAANTITATVIGNYKYVKYQQEPYYCSQNINKLTPKFEMNEKNALYFCAVIDKFVSMYNGKQGGYKLTQLKKYECSLPIKTDENNNPIVDESHKYHDEGFIPDFDYMQECIKELERERIEELEKYLIATGLNNYELTDEDIKILSLSSCGHYKESDSKDAAKICKEIREFRCGDILTKYNPKYYSKPNTYVGRKAHTTTEPDEKHTIPLTCAKYDNNGVMYYGETGLFEPVSNCLVMIRDGAVSTGLVFAHKDVVSVLSHSYLMLCKEKVEFHTLQYIATTMTKILYPKYDRGTPSIWENRVENDCIPLPIQTDDNNNPIIDSECKYHHDGYIPDWDFMEKYIRAIEKIVISDVVKYKDTLIE